MPEHKNIPSALASFEVDEDCKYFISMVLAEPKATPIKIAEVAVMAHRVFGSEATLSKLVHMIIYSTQLLAENRELRNHIAYLEKEFVV